MVAALPNFKGVHKNFSGIYLKFVPMNPNDAMVIVLKDILLCLLGFKFICIVYIS